LQHVLQEGEALVGGHHNALVGEAVTKVPNLQQTHEGLALRHVHTCTWQGWASEMRCLRCVGTNVCVFVVYVMQ
jgi:hypothetical protein